MDSITDREQKALAEQVLSRFEQEVVPVMAALPRAVTQNDANDHNILCNADGTAVTGILDFGDMVHTARVFELGITVAYGEPCLAAWSMTDGCSRPALIAVPAALIAVPAPRPLTDKMGLQRAEIPDW